MCLHEETKRHHEGAALVYTKKRGGGASPRNLHRSPDTAKKLLQLVEPIPPTRPRRITATIQTAAHNPPNTNPNSTRDQYSKTGWCPHKIAGYLRTRGTPVGHMTVYRILCSSGLNRPLQTRTPNRPWLTILRERRRTQREEHQPIRRVPSRQRNQA